MHGAHQYRVLWMLAISLMLAQFTSPADAFINTSLDPKPPDLQPSNLFPPGAPREPEIVVIREVVVPTPAAVWTGLSMLAGLGVAAQYAHHRRNRQRRKQELVHRSR